MIDSGPDRWSLGTSHSRSPIELSQTSKRCGLSICMTQVLAPESGHLSQTQYLTRTQMWPYKVMGKQRGTVSLPNVELILPTLSAEIHLHVCGSQL